MKILITSGGTSVYIDAVRRIANMSTGNFGSQIAKSFIKIASYNDDIHFLMAKRSKSPTCDDFDVCLYPHEYVTYEDYRDKLFELLDKHHFDIIILAAAVSDYGVANPVDGKIRSTDELVIKLYPLPKLISQVREKAKNSVICGFKLLVGSTDEELISACKKSIETNYIDLVIGNDLADIKKDNHRLLVYDNNGTIEFHDKESARKSHLNLADIVRIKTMRKLLDRRQQ